MIKKYLIGFLSLILILQASALFAEVKIKEFNTKKNIHVIFVEDNASDLTTIQFAFKNAGSAYDPKGKEGLTNLMAQLLLERDKNTNENHYNLDKHLKNLGILSDIQYNVKSDNIVYSLKVPAEKLKESFAILKTVFSEPVFDGIELDNLKNFDPPEARLASAQERSFATKILIQKLFQGHPYGTPNYGTLDGRQSVTLKDVEECAKQTFVRSNLVFSVIGPSAQTKKDKLASYIDDAFGRLPEKGIHTKVPPATIHTDGKLHVIPKNSPQSGVVFGQPAISIKDPDYFSMLILNEILGGKAFTSRLWLEIREERGLVYDIRTHFSEWEFASLWLGSFESENSKVNQVIQLIRQEWQKLQAQGITEDEFKSTKTGLLGSFALKFTTPDGIAGYLLGCHLMGIPTNYINERNNLLEKVTLDDVNRAAKKYLNSEALTFVVVGDPSKKADDPA